MHLPQCFSQHFGELIWHFLDVFAQCRYFCVFVSQLLFSFNLQSLYLVLPLVYGSIFISAYSFSAVFSVVSLVIFPSNSYCMDLNCLVISHLQLKFENTWFSTSLTSPHPFVGPDPPLYSSDHSPLPSLCQSVTAPKLSKTAPTKSWFKRANLYRKQVSGLFRIELIVSIFFTILLTSFFLGLASLFLLSCDY